MISVYQLNREAFATLPLLADSNLQASQAMADWRAGNYELVADILEVTDLEEAFHLTNSIRRLWWKDARVTPRFAGHSCSGGCRSTSVGDLMQVGEEFHVVCAVGFAPVDVGLEKRQ